RRAGARRLRARLVRSDGLMSKKDKKKKNAIKRALAGNGAEPLRGVSEIRSWFRMTPTPVWFVSATAFNLLGMDRWVRQFGFLNYYDSFDGLHPNVFVPRHVAETEFDSIEGICNYLL